MKGSGDDTQGPMWPSGLESLYKISGIYINDLLFTFQ